jgi:hypothetical protein
MGRRRRRRQLGAGPSIGKRLLVLARLRRRFSRAVAPDLGGRSLGISPIATMEPSGWEARSPSSRLRQPNRGRDHRHGVDHQGAAWDLDLDRVRTVAEPAEREGLVLYADVPLVEPRFEGSRRRKQPRPDRPSKPSSNGSRPSLPYPARPISHEQPEVLPPAAVAVPAEPWPPSPAPPLPVPSEPPYPELPPAAAVVPPAAPVAPPLPGAPPPALQPAAPPRPA